MSTSTAMQPTTMPAITPPLTRLALLLLLLEEELDTPVDCAEVEVE